MHKITYKQEVVLPWLTTFYTILGASLASALALLTTSLICLLLPSRLVPPSRPNLLCLLCACVGQNTGVDLGFAKPAKHTHWCCCCIVLEDLSGFIDNGENKIWWSDFLENRSQTILGISSVHIICWSGIINSLAHDSTLVAECYAVCGVASSVHTAVRK